ncbi:hypothetical protein BG452_04115 [Streptomyces sp. CBMA123]|nr:hypothetical protein [Streptomyces sp. CBMA123]
MTAVLAAGRTIRADHLIGADGARSFVRSALGIGTSGPGKPGQAKNNTLFRWLGSDDPGVTSGLPSVTR